MELNRRLPKFFGRLDRVVELIDEYAANPPSTVEAVYTVERAVMQLQIEWELFVRGVVLDSATGKFSNSHGHVYSTYPRSIPTRELAGHFLISQYPKARQEPKWYIPAEAIKAATRLKVTNEVQIAAELGISPWELDPLRHLRNFIAHKSKRSALEYRRALLTAYAGQIDPMATVYGYTSPGRRSYQAWVDFMKYVATRLVA